MAIIRGHHAFDNQFTQIPNEWLRDPRLSLKAIGLLAQIMSHSTGWNMSIRSLARANNCGTGAIKTAIEELEKYGYLVRSETQNHNDAGHFADYDYTTSDPISGQLVSQNTVAVKPRHGEMGHKEEQSSIEQHLEIEEKKTINPKKDFEEEFSKFWEQYPKKTEKLDARRVFDKVIRKVPIEVILKGVENLRNDPAKQTIKFLPNPAKWLRNGGWEDEPVGAILPQLSNEEWEARIKEFWG